MKILLHAPSHRSLARAREEAARLTVLPGEGTVRIVATVEGAIAAAQNPHSTDPLLVLCGDSLSKAGIANPPGIEVTRNGTQFAAKLQRKGWSYVHA